VNCPRCQHENHPQAKFCGECGTPLTAANPTGAPAPSYAEVTGALTEALEQRARRDTAIVLGALAGALIPFVFQAGYALVEGAWFGDGIGRHWLGFSPVPAAVGSGVMGAALALLTSRRGALPILRSIGFGLAASCCAFVIMFLFQSPIRGPFGASPAVFFGVIFGLLCAPLWMVLALLLRSHACRSTT
jgi:Double zinc ribbon